MIARRSTVLVLVGALCACFFASDALAKKARRRARALGPSPTMDRAERLYNDDEFESASIELYKVAEGETKDPAALRQRAEFLMGKTLYKMAFYSASMGYFARVVEGGPKHPHYFETLKWLASLSHKVSDATGLLELIGQYDRRALDDEGLENIRDELFFLLGKFKYQSNAWNEAVMLFRAVAPSSRQYAKAKLFEGATYVSQFKAKPAVEAFKEVLRTAKRSDDEEIKPFEDLANLSLARTFYSTKQFELAAKYYDRVSTTSYDWPNSLFESSWANFMLKGEGYSKALGNIHTLRAPHFENFIKPESLAEALTVKATIYFYNCLYEKAADAVAEFNDFVPTLNKQLQSLSRRFPDNAEFFEAAVKIRQGTSPLARDVERAARAAMSDRSLSRRFDYVSELDRELRQHDKADVAWKSTAVASSIYANLTLQKSLMVDTAGGVARQRIERLVKELTRLQKRVIKIEYEILQGQKGRLDREIVEEQHLATSNSSKLVSTIRVDDEHELWPFRGEYWRDELGYYRVQLRNKCGNQGAPGPALPSGG